jgi:hypothetical protein
MQALLNKYLPQSFHMQNSLDLMQTVLTYSIFCVLQVDDRLEKFMSRLNLKNENNTEYWRKRFLGENTEEVGEDESEEDDSQSTLGDAEASGENKEDGDGEEEVEVEEEPDDLEDGGAEEEVEPRVMLAQQLLESDEALEMQVCLWC